MPRRSASRCISSGRRRPCWWSSPGTELVPVADERLLSLELVAVPVELPGGGDVGAVRWELVDATSP